MTVPAAIAVDLAGTVLEGSYRLVRLIGRGGMGAVYEAIQLRLNKRVAIKLMTRDLTTNMVSLARFHREAEITSKLGHPHLVNVIDFGTAETGEPYLVMECLDGEDLEKRLERTIRLPVAAAVRITRQTASALGAAHAQDIIHRDLKPANIFLQDVPGEPEFVKVLDFGISKVKAASAKLTRAQAVIGTPCYMSPEQATGRVDDTDPRADQWALACIAWEMLTGHPPFQADEVNALFYQITRLEPGPLLPEVPDLAPDVEPVLRRALSKRFTDRYPSIREFARAFEAAAFGQTVDMTPGPVGDVLRLGVDPHASGAPVAATPAATESAASEPEVLREGVRRRPSNGRFQTTLEVARHLWPRWRAYVIGGLALVVLLVAGLLALRSSDASPRPREPAAAASAVPRSTLVGASETIRSHTASTVALPPPAPVEPSAKPKGKVLRAGHGDDGAAAANKRRPVKASPKRRIFEEL